VAAEKAPPAIRCSSWPWPGGEHRERSWRTLLPPRKGLEPGKGEGHKPSAPWHVPAPVRSDPTAPATSPRWLARLNLERVNSTTCRETAFLARWRIKGPAPPRLVTVVGHGREDQRPANGDGERQPWVNSPEPASSSKGSFPSGPPPDHRRRDRECTWVSGMIPGIGPIYASKPWRRSRSVVRGEFDCRRPKRLRRWPGIGRCGASDQPAWADQKVVREISSSCRAMVSAPPGPVRIFIDVWERAVQ